ncbi:MAG: UDP-N-acetylmuramoyl-L-alanyl-D-glutamate--2,6-diaminopimelate ligase [Pirellulales bacterium]
MRECPTRERGIGLRQLLPEARFQDADDLRVSSCCGDSRSCQPGDLFVAMPGSRHDGHDFIAEAVARGAAAVLAERPLPDCDVPACTVPDTRAAYGRVCQALAGNPSHRLKVIGVTGTNGKTSTSCLIASILAEAGHATGLLGTLGYCDGVDTARATLTTPTAPVLATWLARMEANGCSHAVMEVSSHALSQSRVAGISFDAVCVTNVRHDHLDYHGSPLNYRLAKARLFQHLSPEGFAILNADDPVSVGYLEHLHGPALTVAMRLPAEITATLIEQFPSEQTFLLTAGTDTVPVRTQVIGAHHVYNCLIAAAVGLTYGLNLSTVVRGLEAVTRIPGRLERIECGQPFSVFVDYAHTTDALANCLSTLRAVTRGRVICVFGAGGDRDRQKRPAMGRAVEVGADMAVVTDDNPRTEDSAAIIAQIVSGFEDPSRARVLPDRAEAIEWALSQAQPGDCVVIAGKGHEDYQIIGQNCLPFDDRELARHWLYDLSPSLESYGSNVG